MIVVYALVVLLVGVLTIPFFIVFDSKKTGSSMYVRFRFYWLWGVIFLRFDVLEQEIRLRLFDVLVFKHTTSSGTSGKKKEKKEKPKSKYAIPSSITDKILAALDYLDLLRPIHTYSLKILKSFNINRLIIRAKLGFPDPATTGMLFGCYYAFSDMLLAPLLRMDKVTISVKPNFHTEIYDYQTYVEVSNSLIKLIIPIIMFVFTRPVRSRIINKLFHR